MILDSVAEEQIARGKALYVADEIGLAALEHWIQGALDDWVARGCPETATAVWGQNVVGESVLG